MKQQVYDALDEASRALSDLLKNDEALNQIAAAAALTAHAVGSSGKIYSCGNGGSMCDAIHFAEELSGRFRKDRAPLAATAISDPGHLTCVANDFGYDAVFSRYIEAHGRPGDVMLGISTSGTSRNVIMAAKTAKSKKMKVITLTGKSMSELGKLADIDICTPAGTFADRCQELHIKVIHIMIELIERQLFPENY